MVDMPNAWALTALLATSASTLWICTGVAISKRIDGLCCCAVGASAGLATLMAYGVAASGH
jgi:hypothetical protein